MMATDLRSLGELVRPPSTARSGRWALATAFIVESLFIAGVIWKSSQHTVPPVAAMTPVTISLVPPTPPKMVTPPAPLPKPEVQPKPNPTPKPTPHPRQIFHKAMQEAAPVPIPPSPAPSPVQAPTPKVVVPTPPPPPSAPPINLAVREEYLSHVKGAIQAAVHFPESAKMLGENGRVLVRFTLHNNQISAVNIVQKGSMSAFDSAAMAALRNTQLPAIPKGLEDKIFALTVWVEFKLDDAN